MEDKVKAPQLIWDRGAPIWRATRAAIKAGFPTKGANLKFFANDEAALIARCHRLTAEQNDWLAGRRGRDPLFDGTIRSVINFWQTEPTSPYHAIEASSRHPYDIYARMIVATVGARRVDALDGRDLRRCMVGTSWGQAAHRRRAHGNYCAEECADVCRHLSQPGLQRIKRNTR